MKTCSRCKKDKPLTDFNKRGNGHDYYCRQCQKEYKALYNAGLLKTNHRQTKADAVLLDIFNVSELRKMAVSPELAERILSLPSMDAYSPAKLAKTCKCSVSEVKSVLLNEQRWRAEFEREAVG